MMVPCRVCSGTTTPARDSAQSCTAATIIRLRDGGIPVMFFALRDELGQPRLEPDSDAVLKIGPVHRLNRKKPKPQPPPIL
jgi:hypothetical protein